MSFPRAAPEGTNSGVSRFFPLIQRHVWVALGTRGIHVALSPLPRFGDSGSCCGHSRLSQPHFPVAAAGSERLRGRRRRRGPGATRGATNVWHLQLPPALSQSLVAGAGGRNSIPDPVLRGRLVLFSHRRNDDDPEG